MLVLLLLLFVLLLLLLLLLQPSSPSLGPDKMLKKFIQVSKLLEQERGAQKIGGRSTVAASMA
jgi:hypothetical protein